MLIHQERIERIGKLKSLPADLRKSLEGLSEKQIDTPYRENGWTVRQVVHHLADAHMNVFLRMKFMLTEDFPTLKTIQNAVRSHSTNHRRIALPIIISP